MNKNRYLLKNTAVFAIGNIGTKLINFILVPLYTYVLSREEYGTVDLVFSICSLITPIIMCNIGEAVMRFLMDKSDNEYEIGTVAFIFICGGTILGLIALPILRAFELTKPYAVLIYLYIVLYAAHTVIFCFLRGKEQLTKYSICSILTTLLIGIFNILFLVELHKGIAGYFLAYDLAYFISSIIALVWGKVYKIAGGLKLDKSIARSMILFSIALVPNSLLWWMVNSSDRIMVSALAGISANGLYSVSYKIPSLLTTLSHIFMQAWTYSAIREKQGGDSEKYSNYIFSKIFSLMILTSGALLVGLKFIFSVLFAPSYFTAWEYSPYLILGFFFMTMSTFVGTSYYVEKNTVGTMLSALFGAVINIILNFILIPRIGANGAAIATCISYFSILCYRLIDTRKYVVIHIMKAKFVSSIVVLLVMIFTLYRGSGTWNIWLFAGFVCLCVINRDIIISVWKGIAKPIGKGRKKKG